MKKDTLTRIYNTLKDIDFVNKDEILTELSAELNKGAEKKAATAKAYDAMHDAIVGNLTSAPVTCKELYDAIKGELPEGTTQGKVQYALTHLWQDEIVIVAGKPNSYRRKV